MLKRTWKALIVTIEIAIIIAVLLVSSLYIYFRYFKETTFRPSEPLTSELVKEVNDALDKIAIVNGVQVVKVDLKRNVRYVIHAHWETPELQKLYDTFSNDRITAEIPVFSRDDEIQNSRIIRLMNHEFDCSPFRETLIYKLVPAASDYIAVVCSISIPPAFTEFKGMVAVSLSRPPTDTERAALRSTLIDISEKIHAELERKNAKK